MEEAELLGLRVGPPHRQSCSYFMQLVTKHGGKIGSGLEKVIGYGKGKQMLVLDLSSRSLLQVENCQKLHHPDVGDRCAGGLSP